MSRTIEFHRKVRDAYHQLASDEPKRVKTDRWRAEMKTRSPRRLARRCCR